PFLRFISSAGYYLYQLIVISDIDPLSLHDALPICVRAASSHAPCVVPPLTRRGARVSRRIAKNASCGRRPAAARDRVSLLFRRRSEEHTSELQSRENLVCRLLLEIKK